MVVILDTNVLLSALFFRSGISSTVLEHTLSMHDVVSSSWLLDEFIEKLNSPDFRRKNRNYTFDEDLVQELTAFVRQAFRLVEPTNPVPDVCRDSDDNNVLQLAEFAKAGCLITGDKDLLILDRYRACMILTPRVFAEIHGLL